jgi:transcriptional regulator with XRE-family HTH domain
MGRRFYDIMDNEKIYNPAMQLRRNVGLTQEQVAFALGVATSSVRRWEKKGDVPHLPLNKVKLLADLYQCSLDDLVAAYVPIDNIDDIESSNLNGNTSSKLSLVS